MSVNLVISSSSNEFLLTQTKEPIIILKGEILEYTKYDESEASNAERVFQTIVYKVLKVYKGKYSEEKIRVAHHPSSARNFKIGDKVCLKLKKSQELVQFYNDLRDSGANAPENMDVQYIYIGEKGNYSCQDE